MLSSRHLLSLVVHCARKEAHVPKNGGSSWDGWVGCRVGSPASHAGPGWGRATSRDQWGARSPHHPESLPAPSNAHGPPCAPEAAWPLLTPSSCQLQLQVWGEMKQRKTNHTKGSLGRWFQSHWSGFFCAKQLKKKKTKQAKIKMPRKLCTTGCSLPYVPSC